MKCSSCGNQFTFSDSLQQLTPFRYRCSHCKTRYRIETPWMKSIFFGMIVLFTFIALGLLYVSARFGPVYVFLFLVLTIAGTLAIESWTYHYISKNGVFTPLDSAAK